MKNIDLSKIQEKLRNSTPEEIKKLADGVEDENTSVPLNNTYDVPRIVATYWRPALPGPAAKILDYIVYKTYGYSKEEDGDEIAYSQIANGTVIKDEKGNVKVRKDYGAGVSKSQIKPALLLLEALEIVEVTRQADKHTNKKLTNLYRVKTIKSFQALSPTQKKAYMFRDPFDQVKAALKLLEG